MPNMTAARPAMAAKCAHDGRAAAADSSVTSGLGASSAARHPDRLAMTVRLNWDAMKILVLIVLGGVLLFPPSSAQASDLGKAAVQGVALLAAGVLVGGAIAAVVKRRVLLRTGSAPSVSRIVCSVSLEALFLNTIFYSFRLSSIRADR